jgi:hypothetical protein
MLKWIVLAVVAFIGYRFYQSKQKPFAGMVASGWTGGMAAFGLPGVYSNKTIVGASVGNVAYAPPGQGFMPSQSTNDGSGGG